MEALKAATTHDYEVYSFAKIISDESELVVVLRAILRKNKYLKMCG